MLQGFKACHLAQVVVREGRIGDGGSGKVSSGDGRAPELRMKQIRACEIRAGEARTADICVAEIGVAEVRAPEVGPAKARADEFCAAELRAAESRLSEVSTAEVHLAEVGLVEIRHYVGVCRFPVIPSRCTVCAPPGIPSLYTFLDFCEMFTVRHGASLPMALIITHRAIG